PMLGRGTHTGGSRLRGRRDPRPHEHPDADRHRARRRRERHRRATAELLADPADDERADRRRPEERRRPQRRHAASHPRGRVQLHGGVARREEPDAARPDEHDRHVREPRAGRGSGDRERERVAHGDDDHPGQPRPGAEQQHDARGDRADAEPGREPRVLVGPSGERVLAGDGQLTSYSYASVPTTAIMASGPRSWALPRTTRRAARSWPRWRGVRPSERMSAVRIESRSAMTSTKLPAFATKHHPMPTLPMSAAATTGPTPRPTFARMLLSVTALWSASRPTSSGISAMRAGLSTVVSTP